MSVHDITFDTTDTMDANAAHFGAGAIAFVAANQRFYIHTGVRWMPASSSGATMPAPTESCDNAVAHISFRAVFTAEVGDRVQTQLERDGITVEDVLLAYAYHGSYTQFLQRSREDQPS